MAVPGALEPAAAEPGRVPALDAARGLALAGAATATALVWLHARQLGPGYRPVERSEVDRVVDLLTALLVDNRVLPLFALALGAALALRTRAAGGVVPRPAVVRRAVVLLGLGLAHAALVLEADVLGALALLLLLALPLVRARARWLVAACVAVLPALVLHGAADGIGGTAGFPDPPAGYVLSVVDRVGTWLLGLVLLPLAQAGLLVALVLGLALVRSGWLLEPEQHRRGLTVVAVLGLGLGLAGAWPYASAVAGRGAPDLATAALAGVGSSVTGPAAAAGVVALLALGVGRRPGRLEPLVRLGRHSLVVYLAGSVVLALVLAPWALGAGARLGTAAVTLLGLAVWAVALLVSTLAGARAARAGQPTERQGRARSSAT